MSEHETPKEQPQSTTSTEQQALDRFFAQLDAGLCPRCGQPMTVQQQGAGVYAQPCGHYLYHGRV